MIKLPNNYYTGRCYWAHMVTFRCGGGCPFCILDRRGRRQDSEEMSGKDIVNFWNNIEHNKGQRLSLIGGETTLHKDIEYIMQNLEGYSITVTTNCKGPFYNQPDFDKKFRPHPTSSLRINTTFHPHFISAEEYIEVITKLRTTGHFVDNTAYVYRPDIMKYEDSINKVRKVIPITAGPYLGFYDNKAGFEAPFDPKNNNPNESYHDLQRAATRCGITDVDVFRDLVGQSAKRQVDCIHPMKSFIIGPNGNHYHCHYKLYYDIDPVCNVKAFTPVAEAAKDCRHYGFCNWCDVPRVGCKRNTTAKPLVLNKLYDKRERERPEIKTLMNDVIGFASKHSLECNRLKWFEYAYSLLYSGHRHRGRVLDVGSARSVFPYYLSSKGYYVMTVDVSDSDFRIDMKAKFGVSTMDADIRNPIELAHGFDMITVLSVIEHVDKDTQAILNLSKLLVPGGIMVVSSDFYNKYIEYPDANRTIVKDRPAGSHTDSRVYTGQTFIERIVKPLEAAGVRRVGSTNFQNVDINKPEERSVRGLYTFGLSIFRRDNG